MSITYNDALNRLKEERCRLSLSQKDMAQYARINQSNYSKVEQAMRRLSYDEMKYLCDTEIDVHYIFTGKRGNVCYKELFIECSYSEAVFYLNMIYSIATFHGRHKSNDSWKSIYDRIQYVPLLEENQYGKNVFLILRRSMNWQQQKMAHKLGVDVKKLRDLENGRNLPDSELLCRLYEVFGIPPALILKDKSGVLSEVSILLEMMDRSYKERVYEALVLLRDIKQ